MASPLPVIDFLHNNIFLLLLAIVLLVATTLVDYHIVKFARKRAAGNHTLRKEMKGLWNSSFSVRAIKDASYPRMRLLLRLKSMSLVGLFVDIFVRRIIDAV